MWGINLKAEAGKTRLLTGLAFVALMTAATVALAELVLRPPAEDLLWLALFLPLTGCLSVAAGLLPARVGGIGRAVGIRGHLVLAVVLAAGTVLLNVGFTGFLMFISGHDLKLLVVLLVFSLGISIYFAWITADSLHGRLALVLDGVREMGRGKLETRISVGTGDEIDELSTAVNEMAQQLQSAAQTRADLEEARQQLVAAVSHDLRTPLATLRAMIESINDGVVTDAASIQRFHRTMQSEVGYLSRLIDDLFELSQIDSGLLQLRPEEGNVGDLVSDTLEALRPQADQGRLSLRGEVDDALPLVLMDVPRMQRVLHNLVQNSLRHTPPDGTVFIRASDLGDEVAISVRDSGEGVEKDELGRIFERFYRGSKARSRDNAGSGLGLTIARGIVELHGGRIWAESERGSGATFVLTLPKTPVSTSPGKGELAWQS